MRRAGSMCAFAAILLAAEAHARPPVDVFVVYQAPSTCPDAEAFWQGVAERAANARRLARADDAKAVLTVKIEPIEGAVRVELGLRRNSKDHVRVMQFGSCEEAVKAAALSAGLSLDLLSDPTAAPEPAPRVPEPEAAPVPPKRATELRFGAGAVAAAPITDVLALGGRIDGALVSGAEIGLAAIRAEALLTRGSGSEASYEWIVGSTALCPLRPRMGSIAAEVCATGLGGVIQARGVGVDRPETVTRSWIGVGGTLRAIFDVWLLAPELSIAAIAPLTRRNFAIEAPRERVGTTADLVLIGSLGLSFRVH
jgi:hypothetical protein